MNVPRFGTYYTLKAALVNGGLSKGEIERAFADAKIEAEVTTIEKPQNKSLYHVKTNTLPGQDLNLDREEQALGQIIAEYSNFLWEKLELHCETSVPRDTIKAEMGRMCQGERPTNGRIDLDLSNVSRM